MNEVLFLLLFSLAGQRARDLVGILVVPFRSPPVRATRGPRLAGKTLLNTWHCLGVKPLPLGNQPKGEEELWVEASLLPGLFWYSPVPGHL